MKQLSPELLIDLDIIRENTLKLKNLTTNKSKFMAILKSDAYGHNIKKVSKAIDDIVDGYGVVKLEEAKKLREVSDKKILLMQGIYNEDDLLNLQKYNTLTVKNIRKKLADDLDEAQYNTYKEFYDYYKGGFTKSQNTLAGLKKTQKNIKLLIGGTSNYSDKEMMLAEAKGNLKKIIDTNEQTLEYKTLVDEFKFMTDVKTIDDLKNIIKSRMFWADTWAISALERLYNVKFIILSKKHFLENEIENVLQCGESDKIIQEKGIFEPKYYIITDYIMDEHYKLIREWMNENPDFKEVDSKQDYFAHIIKECGAKFDNISDKLVKKICNNIRLNEDQQNEQIKDVLLSLGVKRYCCKMRIFTCKNMVDEIQPSKK